jgi:hypothetical protein
MPVLLSERAALIPGLAFCLKASPATLSGEQLAEVCLRALPANAAGHGVSYISSVTRTPSPAAAPQATSATAPVDSRLTPTHLLYQAQAWPFPLTAHIDTANRLLLSAGSARRENELFRIEKSGANVVIKNDGAEVLLAGKKITDTKMLTAGDVIKVSSIAAELQCIRVHA